MGQWEQGVSQPVERPPTFSKASAPRLVLALGAGLSAAVLLVAAGEALGWFEQLNRFLPWPFGAALALLAGWPVFRNVAGALQRGKVTSHTLMTFGTAAALALGEWVTACLVVLFMRVGDAVERATRQGARQAISQLLAQAPEKARVERQGQEQEVPAHQVRPGETVLVRPGEKVPVDGEVVSGRAEVDQRALTGEAMPVPVGPGSQVLAGCFVTMGSLRIRAHQVGAQTTLGQIARLVEQAEKQKAPVQRLADRFASYLLPLVAGLALCTWVLGSSPRAVAAVLVVACSCPLVLATPVAMLATLGASARRGVLVKGGAVVELLAQADVVLVDKTGTLTLGQPSITDLWATGGWAEEKLLQLAASAERYSEHPLAEALRAACRHRELPLLEPEEFEAIPGMGVKARVAGLHLAVGNQALVGASLPAAARSVAARLARQGKTLLYVTCNGKLVGLLAAADSLRAEVPASLQALRQLGIRHIELLTGDQESVAEPLARALGVACRAHLLPQDKLRVVEEYQRAGHVVVMVGDGVNDAPALAQADVGVAMGAGSPIALETAPVVLLRENWTRLPELVRLSQRAMATVRTNLLFTVAYNLLGLGLAAAGLLPPSLAAAAQILPDVVILGNSARLLRTP